MPATPNPLIDLFAGCGGLSLGLERAGYTPVVVNELHPNAMSTYLMNRSGLGLEAPGNNFNDILDLTQSPAELKALAARLKRVHGEVALVAGGPPCQGYSGIGHRRSFDITKEQIPSNHLYREMASLIQAVAPRAFLFENVKGLLTAKWTPDGSKGEIWSDVRATFDAVTVKVGRKTLSYRTGWALVLAKEYGVPQNRPRVLLVGVREDIGVNLAAGLPAGGLLPAATGGAPDPIDLLGDLVDPDWTPGATTTSYPSAARTSVQKALRTSPADGRVAPKGAPVTEHEYSNHSAKVVEKFTHMLRTGGEIPEAMRTKKFAQRVIPEHWGPTGPNITATSLADDYVHFSQPRVPTVREWARLQTFPDWYQFAGRRTTGGRRRAGDPSKGDWSRDLPKYTQIGNAVPVALAEAVGRHLLELVG